MYRRIFQYSVFPLVLVGSLVATYLGMQGGLPIWLLVLLVPISGFVLTMILEVVLRFRDDWAKSKQDILPDLIHMAVTQVGVPKLLKWMLYSLFIALIPWLNAHNPIHVWPSDWSMLTQLILALLMTEFGRYLDASEIIINAKSKLSLPL